MSQPQRPIYLRERAASRPDPLRTVPDCPSSYANGFIDGAVFAFCSTVLAGLLLTALWSVFR